MYRILLDIPRTYFKPGLPCTSDFRVVLGENGVIFATDLKSVVALDASMTPLWSYSSASGMDLVAATAASPSTTSNKASSRWMPRGTSHRTPGGQ
jgi:hypothetical protein